MLTTLILIVIFANGMLFGHKFEIIVGIAFNIVMSFGIFALLPMIYNIVGYKLFIRYYNDEKLSDDEYDALYTTIQQHLLLSITAIHVIVFYSI